MLTVKWGKRRYVRLFCDQFWKVICRFKVMKPGIQKVNVVSLRLASLWKLNLNLSKHLNIQAFIQAVLMSGRRHKKLNLLIDFWNSIFMKFYFTAYWHWTCIQNKLAYKFPSILNYFFVPQMWKKNKTQSLLKNGQ